MATLEERVAQLESDIVGIRTGLLEIYTSLSKEPQAAEVRTRLWPYFSEGNAWGTKAIAWIKKKMVEIP